MKGGLRAGNSGESLGYIVNFVRFERLPAASCEAPSSLGTTNLSWSLSSSTSRFDSPRLFPMDDSAEGKRRLLPRAKLSRLEPPLELAASSDVTKITEKASGNADEISTMSFVCSLNKNRCPTGGQGFLIQDHSRSDPRPCLF